MIHDKDKIPVEMIKMIRYQAEEKSVPDRVTAGLDIYLQYCLIIIQCLIQSRHQPYLRPRSPDTRGYCTIRGRRLPVVDTIPYIPIHNTQYTQLRGSPTG